MSNRILLLGFICSATLLAPIQSLAEWHESSYTDEMTSQKTHVARVLSSNSVSFGFPYGGPQRAALSIRKHPRYGKDVILSLEHAQFLCHFDGCDVLVRFDNGNAKRYSAGEPDSHSSSTLFLHDYDSFVSNLINAKQVKIEAQFYQAGPRIFTFNVARLPALFSKEIIEARQGEEKRRLDEAKREQEEAVRLQREAEESQRQAAESKREADAAAKAALPKLIEDWRARIQAKINGRIVVPSNIIGNPEARFEVVLLPGGEVLSANLKMSSGNPAYDAAVERAIMASQPLPVPDDSDLFQENFRELPLVFQQKGADAATERTTPRSLNQNVAADVQNATVEAPNLSDPRERNDRSLIDRYQKTISARVIQFQEYPSIAKRRHWQGTTVLKITLDSDSRVANIAVSESSGHEVLDEAAISMVRKASPLPSPPERLRGGSYWFTFPVVFSLER